MSTLAQIQGCFYQTGNYTGALTIVEFCKQRDNIDYYFYTAQHIKEYEEKYESAIGDAEKTTACEQLAATITETNFSGIITKIIEESLHLLWESESWTIGYAQQYMWLSWTVDGEYQIIFKQCISDDRNQCLPGTNNLCKLPAM